MKIFLIALLTLSICSGANADDVQSVQEIHVKGINSAGVGLNLTVFYVSGREGILQNPGHDLIVRKVFKSVTQRINSPVLIIPKTTVTSTGFQVLNYLVFAIHQQPSLFLKRSDGDIVPDPRIQGSVPTDPEFQFTQMGFISLDNLFSLKTVAQSFIEVDINKNLK